MRRKATRIAAILDELIGEPAIPLAHRNPFELLVAVALSAQCTDERVNQVTPALFAAAPNASALAAMSAEEVLPLIARLGLARTKAKNLVAMARLLVAEHGGEVPRDMALLEALPGVGHKTASVVMAQAFGEPAFPVDTHIHRLAARWGLSPGTNVVRTEADLKALFPRAQWIKLHLQMIYFGRRYCPARGHQADACPICAWAMPAETARSA